MEGRLLSLKEKGCGREGSCGSPTPVPPAAPRSVPVCIPATLQGELHESEARSINPIFKKTEDSKPGRRATLVESRGCWSAPATSHVGISSAPPRLPPCVSRCVGQGHIWGHVFLSWKFRAMVCKECSAKRANLRVRGRCSHC